MRDMTIAEFCDLHNACWEGFKWAMENCRTMQDVWNLVKPEWLLWLVVRDGVLDERTLRLFACWSVRQVWHLLDEEQSRQVVVVAERFAVGEATREELTAAWAAAQDATRAVARDAARALAWSAVRAIARDATKVASWDAAGAAAWAAARDATRDAPTDVAQAAAWAAVWDTAWDTARAASLVAQAAWLRQHAKPCFARVPAVVEEAERAAG